VEKPSLRIALALNIAKHT